MASADPLVLWVEGEACSRGAGPTGPDYKVAVAGAAVRGLNWGAEPGHFAEYVFDLTDRVERPTLVVRYLRARSGPSFFDLLLDGQRLGQSPSLTFTPTPGWGDSPSDYGLASLTLPDLAPGRHTLRFVSLRAAGNTHIDCWALLRAYAPVPRNSDELAALYGPRVEPLAFHTFEAAFPRLPVHPDLDTPWDQALSAALTPHLRDVLMLSARSPSPYLVKAHDFGGHTNYAEDCAWHSLQKESAFDLPCGGRLGVVEPKTDLNFFAALSPPGGEPQEPLDASTEMHLIDLLAHKVVYDRWLQVRACFLPYESNTLLLILLLSNLSNEARGADLHLILRKSPNQVSAARYQGTLLASAGQAQWSAYDPGNRTAFVSLEDGDSFPVPGEQSALAALTCSLPVESWSAEAGEEFNLRLSCPVHLPAGGEQTALAALHLTRYSPKTGLLRRGVHIYPFRDWTSAASSALRHCADALSSDWPALVRGSIRAYQDYPLFTLPQRSWEADLFACLQLPRAETFSPSGSMPHPFYNFCRAHANELRGWWTYGEHGHEHLSIFTTVLTDPLLAQQHLRGHFRFQSRDGGYPYGVSQDSVTLDVTEGATCPFVLWEAWNAYLWSGDRAFLEAAFESGVQNHHWWTTTRDRGHERPLGLSYWLNFWETVRDDADHPTWLSTEGAHNQEALDLNCYLLVQERALAQMAAELGRPDQAQHFNVLADCRAHLINEHLWHQDDGCYYGRDLSADRWARVKDISLFLPLWAGLAPLDRAQELLRHLHDPAGFATDFPVPTLARSEPQFRAGYHWQGSNWVEMSWLVVQGLRRYGLHKQATALAYRNAEMVFSALEKTGHFREYYSSLAGAPIGLYDYIWSAIPAAMVARAAFGLEPRAEGLLVMPELPEGWEEASLAALRVRGACLNLIVRRHANLETTRVSLNGVALPPLENRGLLIPWRQLSGTLTVEIAQPPDLPEALSPPPSTPP